MNYIINKFTNFFKLRWKNIPLLDRWLIFELSSPLLFAISAFTVVSLSVGVIFELVRQIVEIGLPVIVALKVLFLKLPSFIVISFPMAMLLSTLLTYGRLSENSEIKGLRSLGVSKYRIILPAIILGLLMTSLTFVFNNNIVPLSNKNAELTLSRSFGKAFGTEKGEDIIYSKKGYIVDPNTQDNKRGVTHLFYAWKFIDGKMLNVTVVDFSRKNYTQVLKANSGEWNDVENKWEFFDGTLLTLSENGNTTNTKFKSFMYPLGIELSQVAELPKDARDMTLSEAINASNLYKKSGNVKEERKMQVRIQEKFTLPFACTVFALIGSAFGTRTNTRGGRSQGFGLSIILILIYYILSFSFSSLGVKGTLSPLIAAWGPVFLSLIGGGFLLNESSNK